MLGGGRRQMLLVLTLVVGVLGMHALVLIPTAPAAGEQMPPVATASVAAHDEPAHATALTHEATATVPVVQPVADHSERAPGHGSMPSSMHHVLHLCVAILAALLVLGMAALALWPTLRPDRPEAPIGALLRRVPRRRPPSTSVRLAQLCVLRN